MIKTTFGGLKARGPAPAPSARSTCRCTRKRWSASSPIRRSRSRRCRCIRKRPRSPIGQGRRLPPPAGAAVLRADAQRPASTRSARRPDAKFLGAGMGGGGLSKDVETVSLGANVPERQDRRGARVGRARGQARARVRLQRRRARSREEVDGRVLRARLHRARQDRERLLRAGIPQPLPRGRAEPGDRVRIQARAAAAPGHHRGGSHRARQDAARRATAA